MEETDDEDGDDGNRWGAEDEDDEDTFFDMDEFVLQESTGYMLPTLRFLAIFHTVISLLCVLGYYCLKVGAAATAGLLQKNGPQNMFFFLFFNIAY